MKKIISIFLSILMLLSTSGMAYAQHFCSGMEIMSKITLGEKQLSCSMDDAVEDSCDYSSNSHEESDCCEDNITKILIDENFAKASSDLELDKTFVAAFISVFVLNEVEISSVENSTFSNYFPPPLEQDLTILYETFLI